MASNQGDSRRLLVITADDYGYWPSYNQGILEAIEMGGDRLRQRDGRARVLRPRAAARERGGDRTAHRVRGALGAAQRRARADLAAGSARALRRPLRPLALLPERAQALPRAPGARHARLPDGAADRRAGPLGQPRPPPVASRARHRHAGPPDRAHREQARPRSRRSCRTCPPASRSGWRIPGHPDSESGSSYDLARQEDLALLQKVHGPSPLRRARLGRRKARHHEGGVRAGPAGRAAAERPGD